MENGADFTQWDVSIEQTWRADALPNEPTMSEAWQTRFNLTLQRPAQYTVGQTTSPMTQADLATFLDGFHEAGGEVSLTSHAYATRGVTGQNEASDEWTATLVGDFVLASVAPAPVPEPETYALMLLGLVGLGCVARHNRKVASTV